MTVLRCRSGCGKCAGLQRWLTRLGVPFEVRDVLTDPDAARQVSDLGFATLPSPSPRTAALLLALTLRP